MKIKYAQMVNGKFAICPRCGGGMAKRHDLKYVVWVCLFGCGHIIKEELNK